MVILGLPETGITPENIKKNLSLEGLYQAVLNSFNNLDIPNALLENLEDVEKISSLFLAEVQKIIESKICALFLVNKETHEFELKKVIPGSYEPLCQKEINYQVEAGTFAWVLKHKGPAVLPPLVLTRKKEGNNALILCSLWTARKILGMLLAIAPVEGDSLAQHSLNLLTIIAKHFSITLETFLLYHDLKDRNDLLEQKVAERTEDLRKSEDRYRHLIESSKDSVFQLDANGNIILANAACLEMLGYKSFEEVKNNPIDRLFASADEKNKLYQILKSTGHAKDHIVVMKRDDGRPILVEVTCNYMNDDNGEAGGLEGIARNITEHKRLEEFLIQSEKFRALGEITGGVAHEFNNILTVILTKVQLLMLQCREEKTREKLLAIEKAALDASKTIKNLLGFTKSRHDTEFTPVDINNLMDDVLAVTKYHREKKVDGKINIKKDYRPVPPIKGNPSDLREVFTNIILNALDALPQGGDIYITTGVNYGWIYVSIKDTGIGMTEDIRKMIFNPFFSTKYSRGSGLGMSIAYNVINNHGGKITVDSSPGKGTTVLVDLPSDSDKR